MDRLSKDINLLENSIAKYIYIKYIQERATAPEAPTTVDIETSRGRDIDSSSSSDDDDDDETNEAELSNAKTKDKTKAKTKAKMARPKVLDKIAYAAYQKNIFHQSRSCFTLNQDEIIREDIRIMTLADKAYEEHPSNFTVGDFDLPPDVLRCSFIRKHHHRYYRCKNQIMNKDSDICKKHENCENIYYDNYNDLLEKLIT